jgi:hypothetical protein
LGLKKAKVAREAVLDDVYLPPFPFLFVTEIPPRLSLVGRPSILVLEDAMKEVAL